MASVTYLVHVQRWFDKYSIKYYPI